MKPFDIKLIYVLWQANICLMEGSSVKECQVKMSKMKTEVLENMIKTITNI